MQEEEVKKQDLEQEKESQDDSKKWMQRGEKDFFKQNKIERKNNWRNYEMHSSVNHMDMEILQIVISEK